MNSSLGNSNENQEIKSTKKINFILIDYQEPQKKEQTNYELIVQPTNPNKRKKTKNKWYYISILLLLLALFITLGNQIYQKSEAQKTNERIERVKQALIKKQYEKKEIAEIKKKNTQSKVEFTYQPQETFLDDSDEEVYLGQVSIPKVHLQLPIVKGVGEKNLYRGVATNKVGQLMGKGNYPMAAHKVPGDDTSLFGPLFNVKNGDLIYLQDNQFIYTYRVNNIEIVSPDRVDILDDRANKTMITMYTCSTDAGVECLVVQGEFEKKTELAKTSQQEQAAFTDKS